MTSLYEQFRELELSEAIAKLKKLSTKIQSQLSTKIQSRSELDFTGKIMRLDVRTPQIVDLSEADL